MHRPPVGLCASRTFLFGRFIKGERVDGEVNLAHDLVIFVLDVNLQHTLCCPAPHRSYPGVHTVAFGDV